MSILNFNPRRRQVLVRKTIDSTYESYLSLPQKNWDSLIEDMIYWEEKRIQNYFSRKVAQEKLKFWSGYRENYLNADEEKKKALLEQSITHYTGHIVGNFNPHVYYFATKVIPKFLDLLITPFSFKNLFKIGGKWVDKNLVLAGELDLVRKLEKKGTLVYTPTHSSNVDSILLGSALYYAGLEPVMYGAGLNLFKSKLIGFFMRNLGAYRLDRLRAHRVYKDVLKEYATSALELGFHSLFFPGGTRSRSGAVEKKLKLGLMGTTLTAFRRNLEKNKAYPNIYIVPVNINALLVLEAETLIDDFLAAVGKSQFIIENDEFSKPKLLLSYLKGHLRLNSRTFIHFGRPVDPFGNEVDDEGVSRDKQGRVVDIKKYLMREGVLIEDPDRDRNYTQELGQSLIDIFHCNNRVLSTNLVSFTLYEMVAHANRHVDIYTLLRTYAYHKPIKLEQLYRNLDIVRAALEHLSEKKRIIYEKTLKVKTNEEIVNRAIEVFSSYHKRKTIFKEGDTIRIGDLVLLYYYHNRLIGYNLEDVLRESFV